MKWYYKFIEGKPIKIVLIGAKINLLFFQVNFGTSVIHLHIVGNFSEASFPNLQRDVFNTIFFEMMSFYELGRPSKDTHVCRGLFLANKVTMAHIDHIKTATNGKRFILYIIAILLDQGLG